MTRRRTERPVERLRSSLTSTADLEETIAAMFGPAPPDKLSGGATVKLSAVKPVVAPPADKLAVGTRQVVLSPPDNLSGALYETLDGLVVDAKCIRPCDNVRGAHTASEHLVYTTMWEMLGAADGEEPSREGILSMVAVAARASISLRNLRRLLRSLEHKLALEVVEYEDKARWIPRRYRVWGVRPTVERRRRAGYEYIYKNRNLITLARAYGGPPMAN